jgi:DNA-binding transcriptional LysR family regulator
MVTAPVRRELVRWMQTRGMTERRGLAIAGMSASSLRYQARPDRNVALRARIVALAQRHRRYGVGIIRMKLQQAGECVNYTPQLSSTVNLVAASLGVSIVPESMRTLQPHVVTYLPLRGRPLRASLGIARCTDEKSAAVLAFIATARHDRRLNP